MRPLALFVAFATLLAAEGFGASLASAQPKASQADLDRAERFFQEGKALMGDKRFDLACPKFEESQRIDPATGTLLALALCHEAQGRIATAYFEFKKVLPSAQTDKRKDREALATSHMNELLPRIPRLVLNVAPDAFDDPSFALTLDGKALERRDVQSPILVDPGERVIEARATGKPPLRTSLVFIEKETQTADVSFGAPAAPAAPTTPTSKGMPLPIRPISIGLIGVGAVGLALGTAFGLSAISKNGEAKDLCSPSACTSPEGLRLNDDARGDATASTVFFVVGVAAAAGGVTLFILSEKQLISLTPAVGRGYAGFSGQVAF